MIINKIIFTFPGWVGIADKMGGVHIIGDCIKNPPLHWDYLLLNREGLYKSGSISDHDFDVDENGRLLVIGVDMLE